MPYLSTAAARAVLPICTSVCSIFVCPHNSIATSVCNCWCVHRCWYSRSHTGSVQTSKEIVHWKLSGRKSLARLGNQIPVSGAPVLHWICTNIKRDCVLKVECGRKSRATLGNEIPVSVALVFSSDGLYQLSCPASGSNDGWLVFREWTGWPTSTTRASMAFWLMRWAWAKQYRALPFWRTCLRYVETFPLFFHLL